MKKTISFLLVIAMMISLVVMVVPANAATPEGTAITTASDFINMKSNGTYYLAKDITIDGNGKEAAMMKSFSGTFDGNGHTVTINGFRGLFWRVLSNGVVKNVTVKGDIALNISKHVGGIALYNDGKLENVTSAVKITASGYAYQANAIGGVCGAVDASGSNPKFINCQFTGSIDIKTTDKSADRACNVAGILGTASSASSIEFVDCVNKGSIRSEQYATQIGGIVAWFDHMNGTFTGCVNEGALVSSGVLPSSNGHVGFGGLVGCAYNSGKADARVVFNDCVNAGKMSLVATGKNVHTGGMVGRAYALPHISIENCINSGEISVLAQQGWAAAGGMVGSFMTVAPASSMAWSSLDSATYVIKNCENTGKIYGLDAGGIVGAGIQLCTGGVSITIENCMNAGVIYANSNAGGIIGATALYSMDYGADYGNIKIKNCLNAGFIKGLNMSAGIVGYLNSKNENAAEVSEISNCVNLAEIGNGYLGEVYNKISAAGIVGQIDRPVTVKNCVNMGKINGSTINPKGLAPIVSDNGKTVTASGNVCVDDYGVAEAYATKKSSADIVAGVANSGIALSDKSLMDAYDGVRDLKGEDYTEESWNALVAACEDSFVLYEKVGIITKKEIEDAAKKIADATKALVPFVTAE